MTRQLLEEIARRGIQLTVKGDTLRYSGPRGSVTPEVRRLLSAHRAELIAALRHVPSTVAGGGDRLDPAACGRIVGEYFGLIASCYEPGALALVNSDADLRRRFEHAENVIDELARQSAGPSEAEFRAAMHGLIELMAELCARQRARREHEVEADGMPELPVDATVAIGFSYADNGPGTWESVHTSTHARGERR